MSNVDGLALLPPRVGSKSGLLSSLDVEIESGINTGVKSSAIVSAGVVS